MRKKSVRDIELGFTKTVIRKVIVKNLVTVKFTRLYITFSLTKLNFMDV